MPASPTVCSRHVRRYRQRLANPLLLSSWLLAILILIVASPATGQEPSEFDFDLFINNGHLITWVDLAPLLTRRSVARLREGVDLAFKAQATLVIPRPIWADMRVGSFDRTLKISYQKLTGEYQISEITEATDTTLLAGSLASAYRYLHDSVEIDLGDTTQMDTERHHVIHYIMSSISLTDLSLTRRLAVDSSFSSPVWFLFRQFLDLTDYGRRDYGLSSGTFSIRDLPDTLAP